MGKHDDLPRLTRKDLKSFDKESQDLLLWAQDQGARLRKTREGHVFVYAPNGVDSTSVPPKGKKQNRGGDNTRSNVRRLFRD